MSSSSQSIAKETTLLMKLKERLQFILPSPTITTNYDTSGASLLITMGSADQAMAVKILKVQSDFTDSVGQVQAVFAPLKCQVLEEATAADASTSIVKMTNKAQVDREIDNLSLIAERWLLPNGTAPALSQFATDGSVGGSAVLEATIYPDIQWPLSGQ